MLIELGKPASEKNRWFMVAVPKEIKEVCISFIREKFKEFNIPITFISIEPCSTPSKQQSYIYFGDSSMSGQGCLHVTDKTNYISRFFDEISIIDLFTATYRKYAPPKVFHTFRIEGILKLEMSAAESPMTRIREKLAELKNDSSFVSLNITAHRYEEE